MGSCGAIETIITIYLMEEGFIAPTLNLDKIDERCAMIKHAQHLIETDIRIAAIQNFAFGGVNTCLIIRKI
jgi:3-oxoacyl-[acyl-carrier-protein] synthase II